MKKMKLYHTSTIPNLKIIEPRISTHGKSYVYATSSLEFSLFFGGKEMAGGFDGIYGIKDNIPFFYEAYKGALKRIFDNAVCYIYEVDPSTFVAGKTTFSGELVSESPVKILNCKKVNNVYNYIQELNSQSKIKLHYFCDTEEYNKMIDEYISNMIIELGILDKKETGIYGFCERHFPHIMERLQAEILKQ